MLRRSFRVGLMLGLLAGAAVAVLKMMQGRRAEPPPVDTGVGERWQPPPPRPPQPAPQPAQREPERPVPAPAPPPAEPEPERPATVVSSAVRPPDDVAHAPPEEKEDVRPRTDHPDAGVQAVAVPSPPDVAHERVPEPPPPAKRAAKKAAKTARKTARKTAAKKQAAPATAWVEPSGGTCPPSHPIKAKLTSRIFHAPGQLNYDRTAPDRCYRDEGAAEGDGLRQAKR